MKYYNGATVWGKLDKFTHETTSGGKAYIEIFILCPHAQYGNVRILGHLWGQETVKEFNDNIAAGKIKKGSDLRLEGNIQQYNKEDNIKTTFNFYRCEPISLKLYKAAFRLTGEVVSFNTDDGLEDYHPMKVRIIQEQREDFQAKEEQFEVFVPNVSLLEMTNNPAPGQAVRLKGYIECPEDEFGDPCGRAMAVVRMLDIVAI